MATTERKGGAKLGELRRMEAVSNKYWDETKCFEHDNPSPDSDEYKQKNKFMVTFPFPYMNGRLHLGHSFSLSKAEFAVGYELMKGRKALFPFGFHLTGMPIKACADKLEREMEVYGNPPDFTKVVEEKKEEDEGPVDPLKQAKKHHSKVAAKTGGETRQWNIMKSMGLTEGEIPSFADPYYWAKYFPPNAISDLQAFGLKVDWRRSFVTTDANPYYDSFVRWQMNTLKEQGYIKFGKRNTIYSPKDGQPCMDHDRASGEGADAQEYVLIKMEVVKPYPEALKELEGGNKKVFLVAGTLRPETMYGQTNCWVRPDMDLCVWETKTGDLFVSTYRAARNAAFQDLSPEFGKVKIIKKVTGQDIMGIPLKAPYTSYEKVYTLPMLTIKPNKGTGIVTSVPSDSPDDFAALRDLKKKQPFREKYGITDEMVLPFEVLRVLNIPEFGDTSAVTVVEQLKIQSQNDTDKLAQAKEMTYMKGFYDGTMLVGKYKGEKVEVAKPKIKDDIVKHGFAILYSEPEREVMSRSGDECVVALCDQWFMDYGDEEWKSKVRECLETMALYNEDVRHAFNATIDWLHQWACSRSYGLGTKIPWDPIYLVESLSDSTIYMAYYTVSHYLHQGSLDGSKPGPLGLKPEDMTKDVWDYIYCRSDTLPSNINPESARKMRESFQYWYPMNLRCSGKDLIQNHLSFAIYNHVAMFPREYWPLGMRCNGHLLINSAKMSKSTGNFMTLYQALEQYGADGTRFALADAGDGMDDANFNSETANSGILRLYGQLEFIQQALKEMDSYRTGPMNDFLDRAFDARMNDCIKRTDEAYEHMNFREALKAGFYDLQIARDTYRELSTDGMHQDLVKKFIRLQVQLLAPITTHYSEYIWRELLGEKGSVLTSGFPIAGEIDNVAMDKQTYFENAMHAFRKRLDTQQKQAAKKKDSKPFTKATIYVAKTYPAWQQTTLTVIKKMYSENGNTFPDPKSVLPHIKESDEVKKHMKKAMPFVAYIRGLVQGEMGPKAMDLVLTFDEFDVLGFMKSYITEQLGGLEVEFLDADTVTDEKTRDMISPGNPVAFYS
eukprot:Clim_evm24s227 gene=Clim_evmTU24s227